MPDAVYAQYVAALPNQIKQFPKPLDRNKLEMIIEAGDVTFSPDAFLAIAHDTKLQVLFVVTNIDAYLRSASEFTIDDDFRQILLERDIPTPAKLAITETMDPAGIAGDPERAGIVGPILDTGKAGMTGFDAATAMALIINSRALAVQISLLNSCRTTFDAKQVRSVLTQLPSG